MVQKSQTTTTNLNWLAGFLNHQQYQMNQVGFQLFLLHCWNMFLDKICAWTDMNLPQWVSFREYVPTIPPLFYLSTHLFKPTELNIFFLARIVSDELAPCGKPCQQGEQSLLAIHVWAVVVPEHLDTKSTSSAVVLYCTFVAAVSIKFKRWRNS